ncbi:MAG: hypothetical protein IH846_11295 [Acidobacteria bacterium]|nr:hypothetical protein [Acidobacteriota bacterium]
MPDHPRGFVRRGKGVFPTDAKLAEKYRSSAKETVVLLESEVQLLMIEEAIVACNCQEYRPHFIATESTHLHILVSWKIDREWLRVRTGLKSSMTRRLNREKQRRTWFSEKASRNRVLNREHFDHLMTTYLPRHSGWKWSEANGLFLEQSTKNRAEEPGGC